MNVQWAGILCALMILICAQLGSQENTFDCLRAANLYQNLGCQEKSSTLDLGCDKYYDCSQIWNKPSEKCLNDNSEYSEGQVLPDQIAKSMCHHDCLCTNVTKEYSWNLQFVCSKVECPQREETENGCYYRNVEGNCCPSLICETTPTGQEPCYSERMNNGPALSYCGPVIKRANDSCPDHWICSNGYETVVGASHGKAYVEIPYNSSLPIVRPNLLADGKICQFGTHLMLIGDYVEMEDGVKCSCVMPPFVSCSPASFR